jgi:hypothetical protein
MNNLRRGLNWIRENISSLILMIAVVLQVFLLFRNSAIEISLKVWQERTNYASLRSVSILFGEDCAGYIEFVRTNAPEDGLVIIPKEERG